jgi:hypothetical protein
MSGGNVKLSSVTFFKCPLEFILYPRAKVLHQQTDSEHSFLN